jgi:hypothetical protein
MSVGYWSRVKSKKGDSQRSWLVSPSLQPPCGVLRYPLYGDTP